MSVTTNQSISLETMKWFCGENARYEMDEPFVFQGRRYATDSRVCVRVEAAGEADSAGRKPPVIKLPWSMLEVTPLRNWPVAAYRFEERWEKCDVCGDGQTLAYFPSHAAQRVGSRLIDTRYHHKISFLPNVRFCNGGKPGDTLAFIFDGGEGLIMPWRESSELSEKYRICG